MTVPDEPRASSADLSGHLLDHYALGEPLGYGGASETYRGTDLQQDCPVAVKVSRTAAETAAEADFTREADLLTELDHPGVVAVHDTGIAQGRPYLVLQLIEGPTLRQRMDQAVLTPAAVEQIGGRLARTLAHVHDAGITHCDVKPSNVLLDDQEEPHLIDFGIARRSAEETNTAASGEITGTAAYLAPEQVRGKWAGPKADIYALGLVLIECLTGELEYTGTPRESALARLRRPPAIPSAIPGELADLLAAMTEFDPTERPSARDCADRLIHLSVEGRGAEQCGNLVAARAPRPRVALPTLLISLTAIIVTLGAALPRG